MADHDDSLPNSVYAFSMLIAHLNSSFNPILYALFNPQFQRGYKKFLICLFKKTHLKVVCPRLGSFTEKQSELNSASNNSIQK